MSDWSDSEDKKAAPKQAAGNDWGGNDRSSARSHGGGGDWEDSQKNFGSNSFGENRREGGGRGRGRGRGGFNRSDGNRDFNSGDQEREFRPRRNDGEGGGDFRPRRNDGEGGRDFRPRRNDGEGGGDFRPRRNDGEGGDDFRPRRRDESNDGGGEEKKREIYIPPEFTNDESEMFGNSIAAGINFSKFDNIDVKVTGEGSFAAIESFEESGLREFLVQNVKKSGYTKPTPIQKHAIPIIMERRDMMGCAQTGSGKTAAFILPILNVLMTAKYDLITGQPHCLIVAPTRELVIQIYEEARKFAHGSCMKVCLAYGGAASNYQSEKIVSGCNILVATPGRLMDFVNKGIISFADLKFLVLDEADRMLDMGFRTTIEQICTHETINKDDVTTLMFSATFPEEIQRLAGAYLRNYLFLTVGILGGASSDVDQEFFEVTKFKKRGLLTEILQKYCKDTDEDRILVFVETKRTADYLASLLSDTTISSTSIHGDRTQRERELALSEFRKGIRKVLIATAVAARGLDIKGVTHVINYDLPKEIDDYIHRIGRTGRVGNRGKSTSFYDPEQDSAISAGLVNVLKLANQPIPDFFSDTASFMEADEFGGTDIRRSVPMKSANPQQEEDDWE